jgi:hypothetical protein
VLGLQPPREHLSRNHLALKDLLYLTYQVFSLLQSMVESGAVLFGSVAGARSTVMRRSSAGLRRLRTIKVRDGLAWRVGYSMTHT